MPEQPPFFKKELQSTQAEEGDVITFCCELSKPGLSVQWTKNAQPLKADKKFEIKQDGCCHQLHIKELKPEDSGNYTCQAENTQTSAALLVKGMSLHRNYCVRFK